ncbi:hypothetical protein KPH14_010299 [Odynerus spinipes]|uniref:Uncharacterized protein n=1 Tax=Odynerus spinipes TaxID=1348599 RepID=A0AAD9RTJ5_9HYME|nr:hypothetical protein KPH14_010299 [Odynerus spinipes]
MELTTGASYPLPETRPVRPPFRPDIAFNLPQTRAFMRSEFPVIHLWKARRNLPEEYMRDDDRGIDMPVQNFDEVWKNVLGMIPRAEPVEILEIL